MTVASTVSRNNYVGNGATSVYPYSFYVIRQEDLLVTVVNLSGTETTLAITTDYTVSGVGTAAGGNITLVNANQAWLTAGKLTTGFGLTVRRVREVTQETDIRNQGSYFPADIEDALDECVMIDQQQQDEIDRSLKAPETDDPSVSLELPSATARASSSLGFDSGGVPTVGPSFAAINNAQANALAAAASAVASAASASASSTSATASATSATAAALAAQAAIFRDVSFKTFADSPYVILTTDRGKLFSVDTSGGAFVFTLPAIAGLDLTSPFTIGIKKETSDGNAITINRSSTDTIDGSTSKTLTVPSQGCMLTPDVDTAPDQWIAADFGATAGNLVKDTFSGDASTVAFTLSTSPGTVNNMLVTISGVVQQKSQYSVSGTALTFTAAPPTGSNNIEVISGTTLSVGVPSDGSVTRAKLAVGAIGQDSVTASKTTTYAITTSDDMIPVDGTSAGFTVTLPTAVGVSGRRYTIKRVDLTLANIVTIATTSSQTIDGSTTRKLSTQYESIQVESDGANWHIIRRYIPFLWTAFTPTISAGFGTPTSVSFFYARSGGDLLVKGYFVAGTTAASIGSLTIPTGLTIDTTKIAVANVTGNSGQRHGDYGGGTTGGSGPIVSATGTATDRIYYGSLVGGGSTLVPLASVSGSLSSATTQSLDYRIPITNWEG